MSLGTKFLLSAVVLALLATSFAGYRSHLIDEGYNKAVAEYREAEKTLQEKHDKEVSALQLKTQELKNAHKEKSNEVNDYRIKFSAVSQRLREQQADSDRRVEEASCGSIREYANAVTRNFEEARSHVERLGLEAASCAVAAETLKSALDAANSRAP